jgi:hypothetical protein
VGKFALFSTESGPMLAPTIGNNLSYLVIFDNDPIATGSYDSHVGTTVRGSIVPTLGGVVVQDFGPQIMDQRISFSDEGALSEDTILSLVALYELTSQELYFTDGYDCWLVQFSRPDGLVYRRNILPAFYGIDRFDYSIKLVVKDHENV